MPESNGAIAVCDPNDAAMPVGTCGRALPISELLINASDREVMTTCKVIKALGRLQPQPLIIKASFTPEMLGALMKMDHCCWRGICSSNSN